LNGRVQPTFSSPASVALDLVPGVPRRVHLLGAGGAGLSGAAFLMRARGHELSGHDREVSPFVERLVRDGVPVTLGASTAAHLPSDAEAVARSAAIGEHDPQLAAARARALPVFKYSELLGRLAPPRRTLGVAGTHGKTTTSWMLFHALQGLGISGAPAPGALVGGLHGTLGTNAVAPERDGWFVAEACEYDRSFLQLSPHGAIVTNLEPDHLDYYGSVGALERAFARFVDRLHPDGLLVLGPDAPELLEAAAPCEVWRVGRELRVGLDSEQRGRFAFRLRGPGWAVPSLRLAVPGAFNVDNAAAALGLALGLAARADAAGMRELAAEAGRALARFEGAARRFESWGTVGGVELVHDYAHHPTEVSATIEAARRALPGKPLHVLFQPHQHSRTARFLAEFVESLRGADRVVVADVYGARTHIDDRAAGAPELVRRLELAGVDVEEGGPPARAAQVLARGLVGECAALIVGAGDIDRVRDDLRDELALRRPTRG
jgi:UDP-N-acetylmuramate--alanine ligase